MEQRRRGGSGLALPARMLRLAAVLLSLPAVVHASTATAEQAVANPGKLRASADEAFASG